RDLCDFVLDHKDIALVLTYGALDDFADKPKTVKDDAPAVKRIPPEGMPESDAALLEEIGRSYKKVAKSHAKSEGDDHGTFQSWCRTQRGLWCVNLELWSIRLDTPDAKAPEEAKPDEKKPEEKKADEKKKPDDKPALSDEAKRLRWVDAKSETARFVPWKKMKHPDLGIEV